jgi:hypothetical protein
MAKVVWNGDEDECWEWQGAEDRHRGDTCGYGRFWLDGKMESAHRVSYKLWRGPIADGLLILHRCDNPPCVNPAHLYEGTNSDNQREAFDRGRGHSGNALKTHCAHGHPYDAENTIVKLVAKPNGRVSQYRYCRACKDERNQRRREARAAQ